MKKTILLFTSLLIGAVLSAQTLTMDTQGVNDVTNLQQAESFDIILNWDTAGEALTGNAIRAEIKLLTDSPFSQPTVANSQLTVEPAGGNMTGNNVSATITIPAGLAPSNTLDPGNQRYILNVFMQTTPGGFTNAVGINGSPNSRFTLNVVENPSLSTEDFNLPDSVVLSPNPATNNISVNTNVKSISVINELGQEVLKSLSESINIESLSSGLYFVKILSDKGNGVRKLVVN